LIFLILGKLDGEPLIGVAGLEVEFGVAPSDAIPLAFSLASICILLASLTTFSNSSAFGFSLV